MMKHILIYKTNIKFQINISDFGTF